MPTRRSGVLIGTVAVMLVGAVAGCTSGPSQPTSPTGRPNVRASAPAGPRPTQDPPLSVSRTGISLGSVYDGGFQVHEGVVYLFAESRTLAAVEVATGKHLWSRPLAGDPPETDDGGVAAPVITALRGKPAVVVSYLVSVPASGTRRARDVARVAAFGA